MSGFEIAKTKVGLQEVKDREVLMEFFKQYSIDSDMYIDPSKIPWCAVFMNCCERAAMYPGTGHQNAKSFLNYLAEVEDYDLAKPGDIIVFEHPHNPELGHVAYFIKWEDDRDTVLILGGNQKDKVCYESHTQAGILGIRRSLF